MGLELIHIVMIFIFLTVLLLITTIYSRVWWGLKAFLIVASVFFYLSSYTTITSLLGRPTTQEVQDDARIMLFFVERPRGNFKGRILLLVRDEVDYRIHALPYDDKDVEKLRKMQRDGKKGGGIPKQLIFKKEKSQTNNSDGTFDLQLRDPIIPRK